MIISWFPCEIYTVIECAIFNMLSNSGDNVFREGKPAFIQMVLFADSTQGWRSTNSEEVTLAGGNLAELNSTEIVLNASTYAAFAVTSEETRSSSDESWLSSQTTYQPEILQSHKDSIYDIDQHTFSYYAELLSVIHFYYIPALVLFGSIGNILSVLVFFKTKLKKLSSSYYLAALGLSDTCYLFGLFVPWLNLIDIKIYTLEVYCQFFTFFSNLCSFLSVWFVVAFTVERFIAVLYPLKRQTMCTVRRAKIVISALTLIGVFISLPVIFFASPQYSPAVNETICDMPEKYKDQMTVFNYLDTILVFVVPFTVIVVLNTFTALTVWKFAGVRRTMTMPRSYGGNLRESRRQHHQINTSSSNSLFLNGNTPIQKVQHYSRSRVANSQIKVTKMLLIVSTVFVCLNLPSYAVRVKIFLGTEHANVMVLVQHCCQLFFMTNFGINFILYCVSGQNFRKAVFGMFRKRSMRQINQEQASGTQISEFILRSGSKVRRNTTTNNDADITWRDLTDYQITNFTK
ncbi:growth hormone secretagogue receptor type 1-like [Toxorhynchites rutilus septentrionalis]|uniref:growth hormone secretagogue receptor type 1-like n=1 Tax=Toxorhynchites rutilus septentrionalis TaxID=329112 RepID=UPI00247AAE56|nr:growth hormone secretagogue receptor type 1-like [Toxorhynchites rutilus septentrionalis]